MSKLHSKTFLYMFLVLLSATDLSYSASAENVTSLLNKLLFKSNYSKYVRPVQNQSTVVELKVGFHLISILSFDEIADELTFKGLIYSAWTDEFLRWNPDDYDGIESINVPSDMIWIPNFIMTSTVKDLERFDVKGDNFRLYSNGTIGWLHVDVFKSRCLANVQNFPLDRQTCYIYYTGVGYLPTECQIKEGTSLATVEEFDNGQWRRESVSMSYDPLPSTNMPLLKVKIEFQRKYQYMVLNILIPIFMLNCLCNLVFFIPAESGEKVTYCVTLLLSNTVFLLLLSDNLPKISDPVPSVCIYLIVSMMNSLFICLCTIVNLRIFNRTGEVTPFWRKVVYLGWNRIIMKGRHSTETDQGCTENELDCGQSSREDNQANIIQYTDNTCTWKDVSRKNDRVLFCIFTIIMIAVNTSFVILINIPKS